MWVAWRTHQQDSERDRANDLREALLKLVDLRKEAMSLSRKDPNFKNVSSTLNEKRGILLAIAETLASRAGGSLSAEDWITLGSESMAALNYTLAGKSFTNAVALASPDDPYPRAVALRELGQYYAATDMTDDGLRNADTQFRQAVDVMQAATDPFGQLQTGYTYEVWALSTARGEIDQDKIAKAFEFYRAAAAQGYPDAEDSITDLQKRLQPNASESGAGENQPGQAV